jgi:hypothetical protein
MKLWVGRKTVAAVVVVVVVVVVHYSTYNYSLLMLHTAHESRITQLDPILFRHSIITYLNNNI